MKQLLAIVLFALAVPQLSTASPEGPLSMYIPYADRIYLVHVDSLVNRKVSLTVKEALRGPTLTTLTLDDGGYFGKDADLVILSCASWRHTGYRDDVIGDFNEGDCGWIFRPVKKVDNKTFAGGESLDQLKSLIRDNPERPWPK